MSAPEMRFTVLYTVYGGFAGKEPYLTDEGELKFRDYVAGGWFYAQTVAALGIGGLFRFLTHMSTTPAAFVVRGGVRADVDLNRAIQRRFKHPEGGNDLVATPRNWVALDLDDVAVPAPLGRGDHFRAAAAHVRDRLLPDAFHGVRCVVTATTKSGLRGDGLARMRLWFALNRHVYDDPLRQWAKETVLATGIGLDPAVMGTNQPIYTARPTFPEGFPDPISKEDRVFILDGENGDVVFLDLCEFFDDADEITHAARAERRASFSSSSTASDDWAEELREMIGTDGHVRDHVMRAIGRAVAAGIDDANIVETLIDTIIEYDPGRFDDYGGEPEIARWVSDIRDRHDAQIASSNAARARLQTFLNKTSQKG